jgi:pro-sigmaK processing inhibitor BofA
MEELIPLLIPAFLAIILVRLLFLPLKLTVKLLLNSGCGFLCLWLLNLAAPLTGIRFPINAVTVLTAGILGLPGIGGMAILAVM